ncbi:MAG: four helix bundle protein [Chitinophagaceae bacterium]
MATVKRFEDLECWKNGRKICKKVNHIITHTPLPSDYKLKDQINGSSGSVMDNIAEGFGRFGNKEFVNFLTISVGSANECQSQLYRVLDREST